jgi:hypothetical protein
MAKKNQTVKIKMKTSMAGMDFSISYGDIVEVTPEVAAAWIGAEIAELVEGEK